MQSHSSCSVPGNLRKHALCAVVLSFVFFLITGFGAVVFGSAHAAEGSGSNKQTVFKVIAPPDPNFIPVAVLREKVSELAPGIAVEIVTAPSGDPSAMRAMLYSRAADFALFSTLGGSRFYGAGLDNIALVGVHVWKGVWLVGQKGLKGPEALNGKRVLAVPAIKTPPHMVIEKSLNDKGIRPDFVSGGAGPVLMAQLSNPAKAPLAFVAPEPMVSILLARQLKEKWPVQYAVMPLWGTVAGFGAGETALGALWAVDPQRLAANPGASQAFVAGFRDAVAFVNDPANHDEVSKIVARTMREIYGQAAPASVYRSMLASGRLKLDFRPTAAVRARVVRDLNDTYGFRVDEGIFRPVF